MVCLFKMSLFLGFLEEPWVFCLKSLLLCLNLHSKFANQLIQLFPSYHQSDTTSLQCIWSLALIWITDPNVQHSTFMTPSSVCFSHKAADTSAQSPPPPSGWQSSLFPALGGQRPWQGCCCVIYQVFGRVWVMEESLSGARRLEIMATFTLQALVLASDLLLRADCLAVHIILKKCGQYQVPVWTARMRKRTINTRSTDINIEATEVSITISFISWCAVEASEFISRP